jgi:hypothetical protein
VFYLFIYFGKTIRALQHIKKKKGNRGSKLISKGPGSHPRESWFGLLTGLRVVYLCGPGLGAVRFVASSMTKGKEKEKRRRLQVICKAWCPRASGFSARQQVQQTQGGREGGLQSNKLEFLTHETTCASEMLEKTTCEIFCQKRPPTSGGTPGQATRGTCRLGRQAPAAVAIAGT